MYQNVCTILVLVFIMNMAVADHHQELLKQAQRAEEDIETCKQNLVAIGKALEAYKQAHGDFPEWLSHLPPNYLPNANMLFCPGDPAPPRIDFDHREDTATSYIYELNPRVREYISEALELYGDVIPIVRCGFHPATFDCLNLSYGYEVYPSTGLWYTDLPAIYDSLDKAIEVMEGVVARKGAHKDWHKLFILLMDLYAEAKRNTDAERLIAHFKSVMDPAEKNDRIVLAMMLLSLDRNAEALDIFKHLKVLYPNDPAIGQKIIEIRMLGKPVIDLLTTDIDGNQLKLSDYRGKVLLVDFWEPSCVHCTGDTLMMIKRLYNRYKDKGFDVIGISLDTDTAALRESLEAADIPWRQILNARITSNENSENVKHSNDHMTHSRWLVDTNGTLLSFNTVDRRLERLVTAAVEKDPRYFSPFGLGAYPKLPANWPENTFPCSERIFELFVRVRIKLISQGIDCQGIYGNETRVYPTIPGTVYVEWSTAGDHKYISGLSGDPAACERIEALEEAKEAAGEEFSEDDIPDDITVLLHKDAGIDPYEFLGIPRQ